MTPDGLELPLFLACNCALNDRLGSALSSSAPGVFECALPNCLSFTVETPLKIRDNLCSESNSFGCVSNAVSNAFLILPNTSEEKLQNVLGCKEIAQQLLI